METQEDSIDIAHLKRLALGLVEDESQRQASSVRCLVDGGTGKQSDKRHDQEKRNVTGAQLNDAYVGDAEVGFEPLILRGNKIPHLPPPCRPVNMMSPTQPFSQPELSNTVSQTLNRRMTPENSAPGDTQPVSPSVFESIIKKAGKSSFDPTDTQPDDVRNAGDGVTQLTLMEGDTGHIDLLDGFGEIQAGEDFGDSSPVRYIPDLFPESQRFVSKTPATERKRNRRDDTTAETPSLPINPLARNGGNGGGGTLALSQAFRATQAPSSPFVNGLTSDPLSDRPSPNIPIQNRPIAASISSPFLRTSPGLRRGTTEPQTTYVSMKESQLVRQRIAEQRKTRSASNINEDDLSDDEFDKEDTLVQRRVRQKMIREETREQLTSVTAPARPQLKNQGKRSAISKPPQNQTTGNDGGNSLDTVVVSDDNHEDLPQTDNGASSEEETEQEDLDRPVNQRTQMPTSSSEEDKENYNGPLIHVPDTSRAHGALSQVLELEESPSVRRRVLRGTPPIPTQQQATGRYDNDIGEPGPRNSQDINVADSQPNRDGSPEGHSSVLPTHLQTSSIAPQYFAPKSQLERSHEARHKSSSPVIKSPLPSSPPVRVEQSREEHVPNLEPVDDKEAPAQQIDEGDYNDPLEQPVEKQYCQKAEHDVTTSQKYSKPRDGETQVNSSLSRVYETPMHNKSHLPSFQNTVPETSPPSQRDNAPIAPLKGSSEMTNSAPSAFDNDMLPPPPSEGRNLHGTAVKNSAAKKRLSQAAAILSSPSGRQRRTLTEIASDPSPYDSFGDIDMDVELVTKDDNEFRSIVGLSPVHPPKRRRGNNGKHISPHSSPSTETSLRSNSVVPPVIQKRTIERPTRRESGTQETTVQHRASRPIKRSEAVWDVQESPQKKVSSAKSLQRSRSSGFLPLRRSRLSQPGSQPGKVSVAKEVMIHSSKSLLPAPTREADDTTRDSPDPIQTQSSMRDETAKPAPITCPDDHIVAPNQVFGCYNGLRRAYYPAVCLGTANSKGQNRYMIKFEDTDVDEMDVNAVRRLDLRIGDAVKVDMPGVPKAAHIIQGFQDKINPTSHIQEDDPESPSNMTDIHGYSTVVVGPKQRKSLPSDARTRPQRTITVPVSKIYLDTILWGQFKDRQFSYTPGPGGSVSCESPALRHNTPASQTSRAVQSPLPTVGLFAGMVFAISYRGKEEVKSRATKMIVRNGGRILQDGFHELFDFPSIVPPATPGKSNAGDTVANPEHQFQLTPSAENIGFAALIADGHSRRAKYMQALALNIPCLSGRWIEDCVRRNQILDWEHYLLPAGDSKLLNGATRSRIMVPISASTARFIETTAARPKLLQGQSVLLVMGRGKVEERKKAYVFLTYALGAEKVERVLDLKAAKAALAQHNREQRANQNEGSQDRQNRGGWDWVYVDDHEEAAARAMLPGISKPTKKRSSSVTSKKRKRSERTGSTVSSDAGANDGSIRIVGNEFVCQSLILGKLFEE